MTRELMIEEQGVRRDRQGALLMTATALVFSLAIAATVVSIGIARACVLNAASGEVRPLSSEPM